MEQSQFNYLLSKQSEWKELYMIQERATKDLKQTEYKAKKYYSNSAEYQRNHKLNQS